MSFVSGIELIKMAEKANTSVIAFNCLDYNMVASVIAAAERVKKPAMIMLLPEHATKNKVTTFEAFGAMVKAMAEKATVPIALHLDHCYDEEEIKRAIDAGFTSVMYDASQYDLDENIRRTKAVVWYAHSKGVMVEAELGSVGLAKNNDNEKEDFYTKPEAVKKFTEATGVDALAIAIGNAHGDYPFRQNLIFSVLMRSMRSQMFRLFFMVEVVFRKISWQRLSAVESINLTMAQILCIAIMMQFLLITKHVSRQAATIWLVKQSMYRKKSQISLLRNWILLNYNKHI